MLFGKLGSVLGVSLVILENWEVSLVFIFLLAVRLSVRQIPFSVRDERETEAS